MNRIVEDVPYADRYASKYEQIAGLRIHYTDWNPAGGTVFLLIHGLYGQSHVWDPIADALCETHRVICPDLRGHGDSDWSRDGYWTRNFADDLHRLVQRLGIGPVIYVGHSLGARIGYAYGGQYPADIREMVLSDAAPETPLEAAQKVTKFAGDASLSHGFHSRAQALEHYRETHPEWQPIFHTLDALHQLRENWAGKYVNKHDPDLYWITRSAGKKESSYLWEAASRATPRTLIIRGERSPYFNDELLNRLLGTMPTAEACVMPTGHYVPREQPQAFAKHVLEFAAKP